ncbi:Uncharacterised protein [Niallia circulans]|nr:Uncharacterised protein [Niallia circulans]
MTFYSSLHNIYYTQQLKIQQIISHYKVYSR